MSDTPVAIAHHSLHAAVDELRAAAESALTTDDDLLSVLTVCEGLTRQLDHLTVSTVAVLQRRGVFAARGYKKPVGMPTRTRSLSQASGQD